jgi:hypothetical protein
LGESTVVEDVARERATAFEAGDCPLSVGTERLAELEVGGPPDAYLLIVPGRSNPQPNLWPTSEDLRRNQIDRVDLFAVRREDIDVVSAVRPTLIAALRPPAGARVDDDHVALASCPLALDSENCVIRSEQDVPAKAIVHRAVHVQAVAHSLRDDRRFRDRPLLIRSEHTDQCS